MKRTEFGYGVYPVPETILNLLWDDQAGQWMNADLKTNAFNADTLVTVMEVDHWNGATWTPSEQRLHSYDAGHLLEEIVALEWNGQWDTTGRTRHERDAGGHAVVVTEEDFADGTGWTLVRADTSAFDAQGRKIATDTWSLSLGTWIETGRTEWTYGGDGEIDSIRTSIGVPFQGLYPFQLEVREPVGDGLLNQTFQASASFPSTQPEWRNSFRWIYGPSAMDATGHVLGNATVTAFPNPSGGQFSLSFNDLACPAEAAVLDAQGQQVGATILPHGVQRRTIDLSNEANGLYLLRVASGSGIIITRLLLQH